MYCIVFIVGIDKKKRGEELIVCYQFCISFDIVGSTVLLGIYW